MKKITLVIVFGVVIALVISGVATAWDLPASDNAREKAEADNSGPIESNWDISPPGLERIEFIHWDKGFAKPTCNNNGECEPGENPSCSDCKNGGGDEEPSAECYGFMGKRGKSYMKWNELPVSYVINPINPDGLTEEFITQAISAAAEEWDIATSAELFSDSYEIDYSATYGVLNDTNALCWGDYPQEGVIAVTSVWYNRFTLDIVEFDMMFDTDWSWGDATDDSSKMDVQNIATHEFGHSVGLADVYDSACSAVTMYGYSYNGDIDKRSIEAPDITGLTKLYGN